MLTLLRSASIGGTPSGTRGPAVRRRAWPSSGRAPRRAVLGAAALLAASACGARSVPVDDPDPVAAELRSIAAEHLRCPPERIRVAAVSTLVSCAEREPDRTTPRLPRPLQRGRCVAWSDDPVEREGAWLASGCGYAEQFLVEPCGPLHVQPGEEPPPLRVMIVEPLDLGMFDCPTF